MLLAALVQLVTAIFQLGQFSLAVGEQRLLFCRIKIAHWVTSP